MKDFVLHAGACAQAIEAGFFLNTRDLPLPFSRHKITSGFINHVNKSCGRSIDVLHRSYFLMKNRSFAVCKFKKRRRVRKHNKIKWRMKTCTLCLVSSCCSHAAVWLVAWAVVESFKTAQIIWYYVSKINSLFLLWSFSQDFLPR